MKLPTLLSATRGRRPATIVATAALILLAAACSSASATGSGGSPSATGSGGSTNVGGAAGSASAHSQLVAFSHCMRSHGVWSFPDPQPGATNAKFPSARQLGVGSSQYQAAESACMAVLPAGIDDRFPAAEVPLLLSGMREFSQCMRSRGEPNWPDPAVDSEGRPEFPLAEVPGHGRNYWRSPQLTSIEGECQHLMPSALGGIPVG